MCERRISIPTEQYVEDLELQLKRVVRIVKKGELKYSIEDSKLYDDMALLDKYNVDYEVKEYDKLKITVLVISENKYFEI